MNALTPVGSALAPVSAALSRAGGGVDALGLRDLRYFAAAARFGNLGRAAQALNVTGPAISQQLRKLEDTLGARLLIRHSRGVTPTPAGLSLLDRIGTVLHLLDAPLEPDAAETPAGPVSLGLPAEVAALLAPALLAALQIPAALREDTAGWGSETRLLGHQLDVALIADPAPLDELRLEPVLTERLGLVIAPRWPLAGTAHPVRLPDLTAARLVLPGPRHWIRRLLARLEAQRGLRLGGAVEADGVATIKEIVRSGAACTVLPLSAVRDDVARGALAFRMLAAPAPAVTYAVATRAVATPAVREAAGALAAAIRSLAAAGTWPGAQFAAAPAPAGLAADPVAPPPASPPQRGSLELVEGD